jgi:hypothetical protein
MIQQAVEDGGGEDFQRRATDDLEANLPTKKRVGSIQDAHAACTSGHHALRLSSRTQDGASQYRPKTSS